MQQPHCYRNSHAISYGIKQCVPATYPAKVTFLPLPQPIKDGTRFSNSQTQSWVDLVGLVTYWNGVPVYTILKTVTHPITNRAQCRVTSFMCQTTPPLHLATDKCCAYVTYNKYICWHRWIAQRCLTPHVPGTPCTMDSSWLGARSRLTVPATIRRSRGVIMLTILK